MKLLSVIVPVYNAASFLPELFVQFRLFPQDEVEIILVNDGSTDESQRLCESICEERNNFLLYNQPNAGVSRARNAGITRATGEYIWFCDPDDKFSANRVYNILTGSLRNTETTLDVISFSYEIFFTDSRRTFSYLFDDVFCSGPEVIARFNNYRSQNNLSTVWNKFIRRALVVDHALCFDESMHHSEDRVFNIHVFQQAGQVFLSREVGYQYIKYASGTLSTKFDTGRAVATRKADTIMIDYLDARGADTRELKENMYFNYISMICENVVRSPLSAGSARRQFKNAFIEVRREADFTSHSGGMVKKLGVFFLNRNWPTLFYMMFKIKIKLRLAINKLK